MTTAELLDALRAHLADFELPTLSSVHVTPSLRGPSVTAQLAAHPPPQPGPALLAWADTLTDVTAEAWRVPSGDRVHLSVTGHLTSGASIQVYTGVASTEHGIGADLTPDTATTVALATLREQLTPGEVTLR